MRSEAGKGDARRPLNRTHAYPWARSLDMGSIGCKRGLHVFRESHVCVYCRKTTEQINRKEAQ